MRKFCILYILLLLFTSLNILAQIKIHYNDYGGVGDTFQIVVDTTGSGVDISSTGSGLRWDFSALQNHDERTIRFLDPATTEFSDDFPNSNIALDDGTGTLTYLTIDKTGYYVNGNASNQLGIPFSNVLDTSVAMLKFPATLGFSLTEVNTSENAQFIGQEIQGITVDSLGITTTINSDRKIDAAGTIITPAGEYECIRLRNTQKTTISVKTYAVIFGNFGLWTPLFDSTIQTDTYIWIANGQGYQVAEARTDPSGEVQSVRYLKTSNFEYKPLFEGIKLYPNPVTQNNLSVYIPTTYDTGPYTLGVYDLSGQLVWDSELDLGANAFNIRSLAGGVYVARIRSLSNKKGIHSQKLVVVRD